MSKLLRYYSKGNVYFITMVTHNRHKILVSYFPMFWNCFLKIKQKYNVKIIAWIVLPDHFHLIIDPIKSEVQDFIHDYKWSFSSLYRKENNLKSGTVWQRRFWDHIIRDQVDLKHHIDYIHYNPVKHGLVENPVEWKYSSFIEYFEKGYYDKGWGVTSKIKFEGDFGE